MKKIHNRLMETNSLYAKWHKHPSHSYFSFFVLTLIAVLFSSFLLNAISQNEVYADYLIAASSQSRLDTNILTTKLLQASAKFAQTPAADKFQAFPGLNVLATQRKGALLAEMKDNPAKALSHSLPADLVKKLPAEIQSQLEQQKQLTGTLEGMIIDGGPDLQHQTSEDIFTLKEQSTGKIYNLHFTQGEPESQYFNATVKVTGAVLDDQMVVSDVSSQVLGAATGDQHVLVILANFPDNTSTPFTTSQVYNNLVTAPNSVNAYYREVSFGQTSVSADVYGWYTLSTSTPVLLGTNCGNSLDFMYAANAAAVAAGVNVGSYSRILYFIPKMPSCFWAGASSVGGNPSYSIINGDYPGDDLNIYTHEIGHQLGMLHASSLSCGSKTLDVYANCTVGEYGDRYDTMGFMNENHLNSPHKIEMGYLPTARVQTVTGNGTYTIAPLENNTTGIQALKIAKADTSENYYVDYRQPIGFDATLPAAINNAEVLIWNHPSDQFSNPRPWLLNQNPAVTNYSASSLTDGRSFIDVVNGITITQLSHTSTSVITSVQFGTPTCGTYNPKIVISPISNNGFAGKTLNYTLTATNLDSVACGNITFALNAIIPTGWTSTFTPASITLAPHASVIVNLALTSANNTAIGTYPFTVQATDTASSSHTGSVGGFYYVYAAPSDTTAPAVSITSPANGSTLKGSSVSIKASATDNVGVVKIELYIDGILTAQTTSPSLTYKWSFGKTTAKGVHTITAKAYDAAANVGQASITVYK